MISAPTDLQSVSIASLPLTLRPDDAFEIAHGVLLDAIDAALADRSSVLVRCPREVVLPLLQSLRARYKRTRARDASKLVTIDGACPPEAARVDALVRMREQLRDATRNGVDDRVLVLTDLAALIGADGAFDHEARMAVPMLFSDPGAVFLAFLDPQHALSPLAAPLFRVRLSLRGPSVEALPRLVTQREARALHATEFDAVGLHRFVASMPAPRLRRALESVARQHEAQPGRSRRPEIYALLREWTSDGLSVPAERFEQDHAGHAAVRDALSQELIALHQRRFSPGPDDDVTALTEAAPRTLLLSGPRGGGKRLLARCVAGALSAVALEVDCAALPESSAEVARVVHETLAHARRAAPCVVVVDGFDAASPELRARWLDEVAKVPRAESVILVALDHRGVASGGRFELCAEVPRLSAEDRPALIAHFARKLALGDVAADAVTGETAAELLASLRALKRRSLRDAIG